MGTANVEFCYLYRDESNSKNFGSVIASNPLDKSIEALTEEFSTLLVDGQFFYHTDLGIPSLFFEDSIPGDISWHEFDEIILAPEDAEAEYDVEELLANLRNSQQ